MSAITVTDAAHDYLADLLAKQNTTGIGIRIFITQPGTPYAETCIAYCKPGEQKPDDIPLGLKSFTAWIDALSEPFLEDAVVDYATDRMGGQLTIKAPNAKVPMVNEDSPLNERINYYLQTEINPGLASHGGQVTLVDIVEEGVAVLQFGGGCQGCGMVDMTLKDGVEKTLLERIPELKGVRDVTDHSNRENAYY
ncbi:Fe-S biogenesis protein NfuA [Stutzerimonas azotifigens]|uniref:Fe-S biogenesis protein NfuA n=1 Tax=Stutzerimonas azotifigens TaxID=291995 RepID=UPI00040B1924|nr:Fe-S biogenesis protein NfuA [Stutzerimonas azotifigens]